MDWTRPTDHACSSLILVCLYTRGESKIQEAISPIGSNVKNLNVSDVVKYFEENGEPTYPPMNAKAGEIYIVFRVKLQKVGCCMH